MPTSFPGSLFFPFHGTGRREILGTRLGLCITLSDRSKKLPFTSCLLGLRKSNEHCSKVDSDCWRKNRRKTRVTDTHMHGAAGSRSTRYNKRTQNTTRNRIHMSLVPDFLSLGHWATKAKLTNSQKFTVLSKLKNFWIHTCMVPFRQPVRQPVRKPSSTLKMASAQVVETSVTNNSPSQDSSHPDDLFQSRYVTPGFKPFS